MCGEGSHYANPLRGRFGIIQLVIGTTNKKGNGRWAEVAYLGFTIQLEIDQGRQPAIGCLWRLERARAIRKIDGL